MSTKNKNLVKKITWGFLAGKNTGADLRVFTRDHFL